MEQTDSLAPPEQCDRAREGGEEWKSPAPLRNEWNRYIVQGEWNEWCEWNEWKGQSEWREWNDWNEWNGRSERNEWIRWPYTVKRDPQHP